jgi:hypothetical protein
VQIFDVSSGEAQVGGRETFFDPAQVDHRRRGGRAKILTIDLSAKGVVLQVIEARRALDVGERFRPGFLMPLENLPAADRPLELTDELLEVVLQHAIEIDQVAIDVVEHFGLSRHRAEEEQRGTTGKDLDIAFMGREQGQEAVSQSALAAEPGNDWGAVHVDTFERFR